VQNGIETMEAREARYARTSLLSLLLRCPFETATLISGRNPSIRVRHLRRTGFGAGTIQAMQSHWHLLQSIKPSEVSNA
jgi:hypothetical protein